MFKTLVTHGILQNNGQRMWDSITVAHGIVQNNGWYIYANIYCDNPKMMVFYNLHPLGVVTLFFGVDLILPSLTLHWSLLQNRSSSSHRRRQL